MEYNVQLGISTFLRFSSRIIWYGTDKQWASNEVTAGVPKGSITKIQPFSLLYTIVYFDAPDDIDVIVRYGLTRFLHLLGFLAETSDIKPVKNGHRRKLRLVFERDQ